MKPQKGLKNRIRITLSLNLELAKKLKAMSENTGTPMSRLVDRAIIMTYGYAVKEEGNK